MAEKKTKKAAAEKVEKKAFEKVTKTVVGGMLNIRKEASLEAEKVGILMNGDKVEVIGEKNGFFQIDRGFIKSDYVK